MRRCSICPPQHANSRRSVCEGINNADASLFEIGTVPRHNDAITLCIRQVALLERHPVRNGCCPIGPATACCE